MNEKNIKPGQLKFKAIVDGKVVECGDYWLPYVSNAQPSQCYPVEISSRGIHYTKKIEGNSVVVTIDGKTREFFDSFEDEQLYSDCELILLTDLPEENCD